MSRISVNLPPVHLLRAMGRHEWGKGVAKDSENYKPVGLKDVFESRYLAMFSLIPDLFKVHLSFKKQLIPYLKQYFDFHLPHPFLKPFGSLKNKIK